MRELDGSYGSGSAAGHRGERFGRVGDLVRLLEGKGGGEKWESATDATRTNETKMLYSRPTVHLCTPQ